MELPAADVVAPAPAAGPAPGPALAAGLAAQSLVLLGMAWFAPAGAVAALVACALAGLAAAAAALRRGAPAALAPLLAAPARREALGAGLVAAAPLAALLAWQALPPNLAVGLGALVAAPGLALVAPWLLRASPRAARRLVVGGALVGLAARALLLVASPRGEVYPDTGSYVAAVHALLAGQGFPLPPERTPGYPAFYGLTVAAGGLLGHRLAQALVLGPALALLLGTWARRRGVPPGAAAALAVYLVCCPTLLVCEAWALSDGPFTTVLAAGALALLAGLRPAGGDLRACLAAGLALGAAVLIRPAGQGVVPVALALPLALVRPGRRGALAAGAVGLGVAAVVGPWCARNAVVLGAPRTTLVGGISLMGAAAHLIDPATSRHRAAAEALAPALERYRAGGDFDEALGPALWAPGTGLIDRLATVEPDPRRRDDLAQALGLEAIAARPAAFAATAVWRSRHFLTPAFRPIPLGDPPPDLAAARRAAWAPLGPPEVLAALAGRAGLPRLEAWADAGAGRACWRVADGLLRALDAALQPVTMLAAFLALALTIRRRGPSDAAVLLALGGAIQATSGVLVFAGVRYGLPALPLYALALAVHAAPRTPAAPDPA